ncbi:MAG: ribonuclease Z [Candidatus Lokiarchaeota archaeon]|nr:ribonuclease Z [Candidatus Lokiarchaeota archaeon]
MEITFLGTSAAVPTRERNLPSIALLYNGDQILFDAGEDVQRRFEDLGLKFNAPLSIFISHMHGDHVIGLPGLLFRFTLIGRTTDVIIFGPPGLFSYLYLHRLVTGLRAPFLHEVYEIYLEEKLLRKYDFQGSSDQKPEEIPIKKNTLYDTSDYFVDAFPVCHSIITYGFRFQEKPRPGKFYPMIAKKLKIPRGHLWKEMQMGKTINYKGKSYNPEELGIIGPKRQGIIIAYSADTMLCEKLHPLANNADVFICEATYGNELKDLAEEKKHMTALQCAEIARDSNVGQLILTHISSRYTDENILLKEAQFIFPNTVIAHDMLRLTTTKNRILKLSQ